MINISVRSRIINKKIISKDELFLYYNSEAGTLILGIFSFLFVYVIFATIKNEFIKPSMDPFGLFFFVLIKLMIVFVILMLLILSPTDHGILITESDVISILFYFKHPIRRKKYLKSDFFVSIRYGYFNTTHLSNIYLISDQIKFKLYSFPYESQNNGQSLILLLRDYGFKLDPDIIEKFDIHS